MLIPKIIHQTWKVTRLDRQQQADVDTWTGLNKGYIHKLWTDEDMLEFFQTSMPGYLATFQALTAIAERVDFFRYCLLYVFGGVYADLDTECLRPLAEYVPTDAEAVVGLETVFGSEPDESSLYCQWTLASRPGHPLFKAMIEDIVANANTVYSPDPDMNVMLKTGPRAWTRVIQSRDDWSVHVLGMNVWACGQGYETSTPCSDPIAAVRHRFEGTWRGKHVASAREERSEQNEDPGWVAWLVASLALALFTWSLLLHTGQSGARRVAARSAKRRGSRPGSS